MLTRERLRVARTWTTALTLTAVVSLGSACRAVEPATSANPAILGGEIVSSTASFESQGKTIGIERFEPRGPGRHPAVVVVHGSAGMLVGGASFRDAARKLARRGYVAHVIHYFDLTGTTIADRATIETHFPSWMRTVADAVSNVSRQPNVDPARVGLLGFSLGSYLSLTLSMYDERIVAVVDYFGGLPDVLAKDVKSLPPTLILHGDADRIVPIREAKALESLLKSRQVRHAVQVYAGQGHGFTAETSDDAARRMLAFFDDALRAADPNRPRREIAPVPAPAEVRQLTRQAGGPT